jgi:hypothetical protein
MNRDKDFDITYRNVRTTTGGVMGITNVKENATGLNLDLVATRLPKGQAIKNFNFQREQGRI